MHPEAVSGHFYIYLGLGIYGGGACLHSLHLQPRKQGLRLRRDGAQQLAATDDELVEGDHPVVVAVEELPRVGLSRDRKTGYTKTGYMEEAKTWIL